MAKKTSMRAEDVEAVVLAGGLGTRLRNVVSDVPKVLAPVAGKPFLDIVLRDLQAKGITRVVLAISYLREKIINYVEANDFGMQTDFSVEDEPLGTGGAIKQAIGFCNSENIFVVNGDTFFDVNLSQMLDFHNSRSSDITVAVKFMQNFNRYGNIKIADDIIIDMREKMPCDSGYINGGIYCLRREFILNIPREKFSFEKDILENYYAQKNICAFVSDGYFIDIGVPEDYSRANLEFTNYGKFN